MDFALGVSQEINPLSGMTVNLKKVLEWLEDFQSQVKSQNFTAWNDFFIFSFSQLQKKVLSESAQLTALQVNFFDHSQLRFQNNQMTFSQTALVSDESGVKKWTAFFQMDQFKTLPRIEWPQKFTGAFDPASLIFSLFQFPKPFRIEIQNPTTKESLVLNSP
ncbi:MAG: hypothetical protein ACAH59_10585 [Pseudobdellovibrionaceae bacterium]